MSNVVVIGGSFAGLTGALEAKRKLGPGHKVTLISKTEDFVYIPSLIWVPFGWRSVKDISVPLAPVLAQHGVDFLKTEVTRVEPAANKVITSEGEVDYDYLLVASGVSTRFDLIEGLSPGGHQHSVCTPGHAEEARDAWEKLIRDPGPVVVGASQGASCMGAGYEFLFNLEYAARKAGVRDRIDITWITPEPFLGHFGIDGIAGGEAMLKSFMKMFKINYVVNSEIEEITKDEVVLGDGRRLPYKYSMIIPPFNGARFVKESEGLGDEKGFTYREREYYEQLLRNTSDEFTKLMMAKINIPEYRASITERLEAESKNLADLKREVEETGSKKKANKVKVVQDLVDSYERSLKDIERFPDSVGVATVAAIHFACSGDELTCVIGGTVQDYIYFNGATSLYWGMMLHALNNGYSRYNFYGTFGIQGQDESGHGGYEFKKGFGGEVVQLIGDFVAPVSPVKYTAYRVARKLAGAAQTVLGNLREPAKLPVIGKFLRKN